MYFIEVVEALKIIKRHCQETPDCKNCRLHTKYDVIKCVVCSDGWIPARWEFDTEAETQVPSIFK